MRLGPAAADGRWGKRRTCESRPFVNTAAPQAKSEREFSYGVGSQQHEGVRQADQREVMNHDVVVVGDVINLDGA